MGKLDIENLQAHRISKLPPYVFTMINRLKNEITVTPWLPRIDDDDVILEKRPS
ncbi:MAG: hypothetical protein GY869_11605 [Planctomycetes bacterium]|nr:hypothetical protein [Planctomycetota bacterium]